MDFLAVLLGMGIGVLVTAGFAAFLHELWEKEKDRERKLYGRTLR